MAAAVPGGLTWGIAGLSVCVERALDSTIVLPVVAGNCRFQMMLLLGADDGDHRTIESRFDSVRLEGRNGQERAYNSGGVP